MANYSYRIQQQHIAMARKRQRRRRAAETAENHQGHHDADATPKGNGVTVNVRQINQNEDGILYTHRITERRGRLKRSSWSKLSRAFSRDNRHPSDRSVGSNISTGSSVLPYIRNFGRRNSSSFNEGGIIGRTLPATPRSPPPQSETLRGFRTLFGNHQKQYTIASKEKYRSKLLNWFDNHHMNFVDYFCHTNEVDNNVYRPATYLYRYIDWTFTASFTGVFMTFLGIYCILCLLFGGLLLLAGNHEPNCIVASGESFGHTPHTKFSDAFALSWTTFTTVGYGMTYTSTGGDFKDTKPSHCTWVVLLCTSEAFLGLLFAGMCAAILFGKVNRVQSHANLIFSNAVCLQYEEIEDEIEDPDDYGYSQRSAGPITPLTPATPFKIPIPDLGDEEDVRVDLNAPLPMSRSREESKFVDQFNGCPILKFQVVNEMCNREGSELVDCIMKVVGIKFKGPDGRVTHSQYVRVNLVDFEHPFLSRVWHGVHILDATSPLLTDRARQRIRENNGSWPGAWFDPEVIRSKLEFHDLIVTVAGISNVSAVTVHSYKRYRLGDVLIGYNFAPIVFRDVESGRLEVDLSMCQDVREQTGIRGEDLSIRRSGSNENVNGNVLASTIRIKKSKSGDGLGSVTSHSGGHSRNNSGIPSIISPVNSIKNVFGGSGGSGGSAEKETTEKHPLAAPETPTPAISPMDEDPDTSEDEIMQKHVVFREKPLRSTLKVKDTKYEVPKVKSTQYETPKVKNTKSASQAGHDEEELPV